MSLLFNLLDPLRYSPPKLVILLLAIMISSLFASVVFSPKYGTGVNTCPSCSNSSIIKYNTVNDITYITVPKKVEKDEDRLKYKFAFCNWLAASNGSRIIAYMNSSDFDPSGDTQREIESKFGEGRLSFLDTLRHNYVGIPYIDSWFSKGFEDAETLYVCFINTDILLSSSWFPAIQTAFKLIGNKKALIINQRIDFYLDPSAIENWDFYSKDLLNKTDALINDTNYTLHSPYGVDTFTFRKDIMPFNPHVIPPFLVGRYNWDNWICGYLNYKVLTISFGVTPPIYHIDHVRHQFNKGADPLVKTNEELRSMNYNYFGSNFDTNYVYKNGKIVANTRSVVHGPR